MANKVQQLNNNIKPGACPHGLPAGVCPVCSSSGAGTRLSDKNRRVGEMTYHECAMIGNMLRARALARKNRQQALLLHEINIKNFEQSVQKFAQKIAIFTNLISKNIVLKPVALLIKLSVLPILNLVKNLPVFIKNLNQLKIDITDKLNAIYGEAKAFVDKKISEFVSVIELGLKKLFKVKKKDDSENNDTKVDEDKKLFNLKNTINKIISKFKKKKDKNESDTEN